MLRNVFLSILILVLFGWSLSSLYSAYVHFAEIVKNDTEPPWEVTMNITPLFILIIIGIILTVSSYIRQKRKGRSWFKSTFLPHEFEEGDEREVLITMKATRAAYISMWFSIPIIASLLVFYPFIYKTIPYYPIIVFLLYPLVQITTYTISWRKNYKH